MTRRSRVDRRAPTPNGVATRHLVLVAVDDVDRRLTDLCALAAEQGGATVQALVLADDPEAARDALGRWRRRELADVPVELVDACSQTVAAAIGGSVRSSLANGWDHVTVVVPHLVVAWPWRALHNHTERAVARSLRGVPHVDVVRVPVELR